MENKHTPGPWETFGPLPFTVYGGDPKSRIAVIDYIQGNDSEVNDANARLIAAAPELLGCLKSLSDIVHIALNYDQLADDEITFKQWNDSLNAARAAISKAEGK